MRAHYSRRQLAAFAILFAITPAALPREADTTVPPQARSLMLSMPRPQYPEEALRRHITGSGKCELLFDVNTGRVTRVLVLESSGSKLLNDAAVRAYLHWRARPGKVSRMRVPFTFTFQR